MTTKNVGDRVKTKDGEGVVRAVLDAAKLYPGKVLYKKSDRRKEKPEQKYPAGTKVYQVRLDAQPVHEDGPRVGQRRFAHDILTNYHQSQLVELTP